MVSIELEGVESLQLDLREYPKRANRILVRALNRGIASGRTAIVREIARDTGLKSGDVREKIVMQAASFTRLHASLAASLKRIPLQEFHARQTRTGVSYRLPGGRQSVPHAFIARMRSGHDGVFVRVGKARLPIRELFGPSLGRVFAKFRAMALVRAEESFRTNLDHELSRLRGD